MRAGTMVTPMRTHLIRKGMTLYKADFTDGETLIHVTLFNTKFQAEKLRMYQDYLLLGKVERNFTTLQMSAPKIEPLTARRIHPIYTQTGSLNANLIAKAVDYALAHMRRCRTPCPPPCGKNTVWKIWTRPCATFTFRSMQKRWKQRGTG